LSSGVLLQEFVQRDRQFPNAFAGRVVDGVRNCRRDRYCREFAHTLHADWACLVVEFTHEQDVELRDVRVRWDEVPGEVTVHKSSHHWISVGLLEQRLADAPDHPSDGLASSRFWIDDPAGIVGAYETVQADQTEIRIYPYFCKDRREAKDRLRAFVFFDRVVVSIPNQR